MTSTRERDDTQLWNLAHDPDPDPGSDALAPGTDLGRYRIARLIGRGGMGYVYEAVHRDLNKRVAIKTLLPALAINPDARRRFLREGQAASRIRHPHVVDVTDVVADGPASYLVMEYLEGEDLSARIARRGWLSLVETADIMLPVLAAIAEAHGQGVVHRDLKPENVFLAQAAHGGASPKVLDFGISKVLGDAASMPLTGTSVAFGTVYYLPPELLRGAREADARSDQYALGAILYECLTGRRAFDGDGIYPVLKRVAEGDYRAARSLRPDLPASVDAAIARALNVDPAARFASVKELGAALVAFASAPARMLWTSAFTDVPVAQLLVAAPVLAPVAAPVLAPVAAPVAAPALAPVAAPAADIARVATRTMILPPATDLDVVPRRPPSPFVVTLLIAATFGVALVATATHTRRNRPPAPRPPSPPSDSVGTAIRSPTSLMTPPPALPLAPAPPPPPLARTTRVVAPRPLTPHPEHGKRKARRTRRPRPPQAATPEMPRTNAPIIDD